MQTQMITGCLIDPATRLVIDAGEWLITDRLALCHHGSDSKVGLVPHLPPDGSDELMFLTVPKPGVN